MGEHFGVGGEDAAKFHDGSCVVIDAEIAKAIVQTGIAPVLSHDEKGC
jgi:hypothetical protein